MSYSYVYLDIVVYMRYGYERLGIFPREDVGGMALIV
jgi:hypothetical protein